MRFRHRMSGCRPEPLGSYLKALGVLRLVGEQVDAEATAWWEDDELMLACHLDRPALEEFFLDRYIPTPLVAPWNGGSGFSPKDKGALVARRLIEASTSDRLSAYRQALGVAQRLADRSIERGWSKEELIESCRGSLPESSVAWIDAAIVLTPGKPRFPPLLGTGGNDGRLDFGANFMHRVADVLGLRGGRGSPTRLVSQGWIAAALFADVPVAGIEASVGQFDPGSAGGANSSPVGEAPSLVNPWNFVLTLEGALVLAGAAARRLGADTDGKAAMPFTMDASGVGYPSSALEEKSRGELWAPLWSRPATLAELAQLIGEGRSEWCGRQARSGLDMVRAVASLGVDRGIEGFVRHAFLERRGLATAAVVVGRVGVRERPEVPLLGQLDTWLQRAGRESPPDVATAIAQADRSMYNLAAYGGSEHLQSVLFALADAEAAVARAPAFRKRSRLQPVSWLKAADWLPYLDDATPELRIAAALASLRDGGGECLRRLLTPVTIGRTGKVVWSDSPARVTGLGMSPICEVLARAHAWRSIEVASRTRDDQQVNELPGVQTSYQSRLPAPAGDVAAFVAGLLDDQRVESLLRALLLFDWSPQSVVLDWFSGQPAYPPRAVPAWGLLAPFFHGRGLKKASLRLVPESSWPAQLAGGRVRPVIDAALRRLRMARLDPALQDAGSIARLAPAGPRLGAALLVPISTAACDLLLRSVVPGPIDAAPDKEVS